MKSNPKATVLNFSTPFQSFLIMPGSASEPPSGVSGQNGRQWRPLRCVGMAVLWVSSHDGRQWRPLQDAMGALVGEKKWPPVAAATGAKLITDYATSARGHAICRRHTRDPNLRRRNSGMWQE